MVKWESQYVYNYAFEDKMLNLWWTVILAKTY